MEKYFAGLRTKLSRLEKTDPNYKKLIKEVSEGIRNSILRYVMVRRTRKDVMTYFKQDMKLQGLTFPELDNPQKIVYEYKGELEKTFIDTINKLKEFTYARYTPLLYYIGNKTLTEFEKQQQRNVGGFMKGILVKRLESSFHAFRQSVDRFIVSYEKFIDMYQTQKFVYISKKIDVYDLIESDNIEKLEAFVDEEKAHKYDAKDFGSFNNMKFIDALKKDLEILKEIQLLWKNVQTDPKLEKFIQDLKDIKALSSNKLVVFTESKETGDYIYEALIKEFPGKVMFYSSTGGRHSNEQLTSNHVVSRDLITANYDPNRKSNEQSNELKILIATDVLAEGVNLHRSNVLINYDLPWNPTRVLQRAGRVNRLGSKFPKVHIFNFFPTTQSDAELQLEVNITNKIQMFHDVLGEDAKYLSDGEEFGSQELFNTLNSKTAYTGEEGEGDSELKYLELMRKIRDEQPELFDKIKHLPKKARSGFQKEKLEVDKLVTFFRIGKLKKFYQNQNGTSGEITFFDAVKELECKPDTLRATIPTDYFQYLQINKARFELDTTVGDDGEKPVGGLSNAKYIENRLKDKVFRNYKGFTELNEEFIDNVKEMLEQGTIAKKTSQMIKKEFEKTLDPLEMLHILEKHIRYVAVEGNKNAKKFQKREVILSGYLIK